MAPFHASTDACPFEARGEIALPDAQASAWLEDGHRPFAEDGRLAPRLRRLVLPMRGEDGNEAIATADGGAENRAWIRANYGASPIRIVSQAVLVSKLVERFGHLLTEQAVFGLARACPDLSAFRVVTGRQGAAFAVLMGLAAFAMASHPLETSQALVAAASLLFWTIVLFRACLALAGARAGPASGEAEPRTGRLDAYPDYTIIVPLYREAHMVPPLARSLLALDYPRDRLQIMLAVEADDRETVCAAEALAASGPFEIVRIPPSAPRTKPKAVNFALQLARGDYLVIYDAEDRPETDQLTKAIAAFRKLPRLVACLQARLSFHNRDCWIARQSALDYNLWFGFLLPGLQRLGVPIPLGGTSNHFRTSVLRAIHGWDPFNVTEDADIGIRLAALGYRVAMLDSTTHEEAPERIGAWIRQRSRWLKGYMQTWLVHSRCMPQFVGRAGLRGYLAFHLFIGGTVLSALLNPILWAVLLVSALSAPSSFEDCLGTASGMGLITSNVLLTALTIAGSRGSDGRLAPHGAMVALYWLLISVAGYRALWHLAIKPFHWEKTAHGLSSRHA